MDSGTLRLARIIWDYLQLGHQTIPGEVIVVFGTNDLRVAEFAARLHSAGYGRTLICTGGMAHGGDLLETGWSRTEAEVFADEAESCGVPRECILLEPRATNTAENVRFTRELCAAHGIRPRNVVLAMKPFMQRRVWATMAVEWPEMPATLASPQMTLEEYVTADLPAEKVIHIMMGDLQRLWIYGRKGWSAPQRIPAEVDRAYRELIARGFTRHLLPE